MKTAIAVFGALILLVGVSYFGKFAYDNLRGVGPAVFPPPEDIGDLIDAVNETSLPNGSKATNTPRPLGEANTTGMPLKLPPEFSISIFARDLEGPRVMQWDPVGNLLVSLTSAGKVVALKDTDGDGKVDRTTTVLQGLYQPHGLATRCTDICRLYVAESDKVQMYEYTADNSKLKSTNGVEIVDLPSGGGHFTRTIMFRPHPNDAELLVSIGSSCNVCDESDPRRATIQAVNVETKAMRLFAKGLRNAVFLATHPVTGATWVTEMGRDRIGDDIPPDEINIAEEGNPSIGLGVKNYGWPICYGKNIHDTDYDKNTYFRNPCEEPFETPSYIDLQAHSAPLGIAFVLEDPPRLAGASGGEAGGWPEDWWYDAIVAYHGSWNRTVPTGYKLVRLKLDAKGNYSGTEDFITGWLTADGALGRPVDVLIQPGGTMYVSDDKAGVIYRITYRGPTR